jgi:hypothetical protein
VAGPDHGCFFATPPTVSSTDYTLLQCPTAFGAPSTIPVVGSTSPPTPRDTYIEPLVPIG